MNEKEQKARIEITRGDSDEWPDAIKRRFEYLAEVAKNNHFSIVCAVGLHHDRKRLSLFIPPTSSGNPHLVEMLEDIAVMFRLIAQRLKQ